MIGREDTAERRKVSTASTRRWSSSAAARPSLPKMLETCFSTAPSVTTSARGDRRVGAALGHQLQHLALARGQRGQRRGRAPRARHELGDHLGVQRRAAGGHAPHGVHEVARVADALLEQVADPAPPSASSSAA